MTVSPSDTLWHVCSHLRYDREVDAIRSCEQLRVYVPSIRNLDKSDLTLQEEPHRPSASIQSNVPQQAPTRSKLE